MSDPEDRRAEMAASADEEAIGRFLHDPSPRVIKSLLRNRNLAEQDVLIIAGRKNLPGDVLELIARDKRWAESYPLRVALSKNPKTPLFTALTIARYLRLFDLAEISRSHSLPLVYRHKLEALLIEKIPTMARGPKKTLAKMAAGNVLLALLRDPGEDVVRLCLNNPSLTEGHLIKIVSRHDTVPQTVRAVAEHPNWSSRYTIRLALTRNRHTPLARCVVFFRDFKIRDLHELYSDPTVPTGVKPFLHQTIVERGEEPGKERLDRQEVYDIPGERGDTADERNRDDLPGQQRAGDDDVEQ